MNNQEVQQATDAFKACEEQHIQQITDRLTSPARPAGQPFSIALGNQVWGPEGLHCEGYTNEMAQQICDALNIQASALFWLTFAIGKGISVPESLILQFHSTIGAMSPEIMEAANKEDFDYATEMGLIQ